MNAGESFNKGSIEEETGCGGKQLATAACLAVKGQYISVCRLEDRPLCFEHGSESFKDHFF